VLPTAIREVRWSEMHTRIDFGQGFNSVSIFI